MNECDPPQTRDAAGSDSVYVMHVLWCLPQVICSRNHAPIVKAAVDQPLEENEVESRG